LHSFFHSSLSTTADGHGEALGALAEVKDETHNPSDAVGQSVPDPLPAVAVPPVAVTQPASNLPSFTALSTMVAEGNYTMTQHGDEYPGFQQAVAVFVDALPAAGLGAVIQQHFQTLETNIITNINNSITTAMLPVITTQTQHTATLTGHTAALTGLTTKVEPLYADYVQRHNKDARIRNQEARDGLDPLKWLFKADRQLPRLSGEPPRELPKNLQQLQELLEVDLDDLTGGYGIILDLSNVAADEHHNQKMAALKRHLFILF
jgi:hypothetical protein